MSEQCQDTLRCDPQDLRQAMSIHTRKITDACRDKDCIEDLRVYPTESSQTILDSTATVRVRSATLIGAYIDVEPVAFDRHHYCIDVTFYYRILADGTVGTARPAALTGLAVFTKRAVLCGEDSRAHIFTSDTILGEADGTTTMTGKAPTAVVEVLDPMILSSQIQESTETTDTTIQIPDSIRQLFDEDLVTNAARRLYVTLGQFSVIRLERDVQLIVPWLNYAIPTKECCDSPGCAEDPCEMFSRIPFPAQQFAPTGCDDPDCSCPCGQSPQ